MISYNQGTNFKLVASRNTLLMGILEIVYEKKNNFSMPDELCFVTAIYKDIPPEIHLSGIVDTKKSGEVRANFIKGEYNKFCGLTGGFGGFKCLETSKKASKKYELKLFDGSELFLNVKKIISILRPESQSHITLLFNMGINNTRDIMAK